MRPPNRNGPQRVKEQKPSDTQIISKLKANLKEDNLRSGHLVTEPQL